MISASKLVLPAPLERALTNAIHAVADDTGEQATHLGTALKGAIARDPQNQLGLRVAVFDATIQATSFRSSPMQAKVAMHTLVGKIGDRFDNAVLAAALRAHVPQ